MPTAFIHCNNTRYKISAFVTASDNVAITVWGSNEIQPLAERQFSPTEKVNDVYKWLESIIPNYGQCVYPVELSEFLGQLG